MTLFLLNRSGHDLEFQWGGDIYTVPQGVSRYDDDAMAHHAISKNELGTLAWHPTAEVAEEAVLLMKFAAQVRMGREATDAAEESGFKRADALDVLRKASEAGYLT